MKNLWLPAVAALALAQQAAKPVSTGPAVGTQAPDFKAMAADGQMRMLPSIMGPKGALLVFFRSADW